MENVNIIKGSLRQAVSLQAYERQYKPNGWTIDETETQPNEIQETVKTFKTEPEVKNFFAMKRREPKKFNDGLFKSENQT